MRPVNPATWRWNGGASMSRSHRVIITLLPTRSAFTSAFWSSSGLPPMGLFVDVLKMAEVEEIVVEELPVRFHLDCTTRPNPSRIRMVGMRNDQRRICLGGITGPHPHQRVLLDDRIRTHA